MNRYLLDTNVVSELRKPRPHGGVVAWLNHQEEDELFLSAVTMENYKQGLSGRAAKIHRRRMTSSLGQISWQPRFKYCRWIHRAFGSGAGSWTENQTDCLKML